MSQPLPRIIGLSQAMTDYPEVTPSTFDRHLRSDLALVVIANQVIGLDRRELNQKKDRKRRIK